VETNKENQKVNYHMSRDKIIKQTLEQLAQNYYTSRNDNERDKTNNYAVDTLKVMHNETCNPLEYYIAYYEKKKVEYKPKE
jgi:hypothetical protein